MSFVDGGKYVLSFLFLLLSVVCFSQVEDSLYIADYAKRNNIELYNGYNSTRLHFHTPGNKQEAANFFSNNGLFTGVYLTYKWLIVGYGINVPFTSRDNAVKGFKSYRFHFNGYYHGWGITGSSDMYKGLLSQTYKNAYTPVDGVRYTSISADIFHVTNSEKYSYKAAQYFGQQQLRSCGSFIYHVRPSYYALGLQSGSSLAGDSVQHFVSGNPRWLSLITSVGYGYNVVWNGSGWMISPRAEAGVGGLYQFGIEKKIRASAFFRTALTAGYSTCSLYGYVSAETINSTNFFASTVLADDRLRLSLTAGYRLPSLKKKIIGLL